MQCYLRYKTTKEENVNSFSINMGNTNAANSQRKRTQLYNWMISYLGVGNSLFPKFLRRNFQKTIYTIVLIFYKMETSVCQFLFELRSFRVISSTVFFFCIEKEKNITNAKLKDAHR